MPATGSVLPLSFYVPVFHCPWVRAATQWKASVTPFLAIDPSAMESTAVLKSAHAAVAMDDETTAHMDVRTDLVTSGAELALMAVLMSRYGLADPTSLRLRVRPSVSQLPPSQGKSWRQTGGPRPC